MDAATTDAMALANAVEPLVVIDNGTNVDGALVVAPGPFCTKGAAGDGVSMRSDTVKLRGVKANWGTARTRSLLPVLHRNKNTDIQRRTQFS